MSEPVSLPPAGNRPAIFLDRDGTLNRIVRVDDKPFPPRTLEEFVLFEDAAAGCQALARAGFTLVVVTNQPDVGRGTLDQAMVERLHALLRTLIPELARIEVCFDAGRGPETDSPRRKPAPGMLLDAARELNLDLTRSWIIGDRWRDVDCGQRAGVRTVFIDYGYDEALKMPPDYTVGSFAAAVDVVLGASAQRPGD